MHAQERFVVPIKTRLGGLLRPSSTFPYFSAPRQGHGSTVRHGIGTLAERDPVLRGGPGALTGGDCAAAGVGEAIKRRHFV